MKQTLQKTILQNIDLPNIPVLAAASAIVGVLLAQNNLPYWLNFLPFFLAIFILLVLFFISKSLFISKNATPQKLFLIGLAVLIAPMTAWRYNQLQNATDHFENLSETVKLSGNFDGTYFQVAQPAGTILVAPRDAITPGQWLLEGKLESVRSYKNFGSFDYAAWLAKHGVKWRLRITKKQKLGQTHLQRIREWLIAGAGAGMNKTASAFMVALTVGETTGLRDAGNEKPNNQKSNDTNFSWRDVFARAGLGHLLALSGQQVTMLAAAITLALFWLGVWRYPVVMIFLLLYWWIVGGSASVTRAIVSALVVLLNLWLGRGRVNTNSVVAWSVLLSLLLEPRWLSDAGFLLSHLAVLGMMLVGATTLEFLKNKPKFIQYLGTGLAATLGAELLTLPITASIFGIVPLFAPLVNLLVEPISLVLVPLGFLASVLGPQWGSVVNIVVAPLANLTLWLAQVFSVMPVLPWGVVSTFGYVVAYACIAILLLAWHKRVSVNNALLAVLAAILLTALPKKTEARAEINFLDIGQGDSTLIRLPQTNILLDGGGTPNSGFDIAKAVVLPTLRAAGIFSLNAIIATHADADHMEGLISVLENIPVGVLLIGHGKPKGQDNNWDAMLNAARKHHVPIQFVRRGETWNLENTKIIFLHPRNQPYPEDNWNSVSFVLQYQAHAGPIRRLLFLGDAPSEIEAQLHPGHLDVLKLAHHGSRFSTSESLLNRAQPKAAIVSAGIQNRYGHPTKLVLDRLAARNIRVYRTDRDGAIKYNLETGFFEVANPNPSVGEVGKPGWRPTIAPKK